MYVEKAIKTVLVSQKTKTENAADLLTLKKAVLKMAGRIGLMNLLKDVIKRENTIFETAQKALIKAPLKIADDDMEIRNILSLDGYANIENAKADMDKVLIEGSAVFCILYTGPEDQIGSFESKVNFQHWLEVEGAAEEMDVFHDCCLGEMEYKLMGNRDVEISALLDVSMILTNLAEEEVVVNVEGPQQVETKRNKNAIAFIKDSKQSKVYLKEDFRIPQNMPTVKEVLFKKAYAMVKNVMIEDGKIIVEGDVRIFIVYHSTDKNAKVQYLCESIPFGEMIMSDGFVDAKYAYATASVENIESVVAFETDDIITVNVTLNICAIGYDEKEYDLIEDLYSRSNDLELKVCCVQNMRKKFIGCCKNIIRIGHTLKNTDKDVARVLYAYACPRISMVKPHPDRVVIEGIMDTTICYTTKDAGMHSIKAKLPFNLECQIEGVNKQSNLDVNANVEYVVVEGSGKELDIKYSVEVRVDEICKNNLCLVKEIEDKGPLEQAKRGIIVYTADDEESYWDIAKKFRVPQNNIIVGEKDASKDKPKYGEKIMIIA